MKKIRIVILIVSLFINVAFLYPSAEDGRASRGADALLTSDEIKISSNDQNNETHGSLSISGTANDVNKKPIAHAKVSIQETNAVNYTDNNGNFAFKNLVPGTFHLKVEKAEFGSYVSDSLVLVNKDIVLEIVMLVKIQEKIVVTATRTAFPLKEVPIRTELISFQQMEDAGTQTVYDDLNKLAPGVWVQQSCTSCNYAQLRMQGLEGGYSQVLIDGEPVMSGLADVYGLQQLTNSSIQQIEIVKGTSSALYGAQAVAGVINIITKEPSLKPEGSLGFTYGSFSTYDFSASGSYRKDFFGITAAAQKDISGYVDENHDDFSEKAALDDLDVFVKTNFYFSRDLHKISLFGRYIDEYRKGGYIPHIEDQYDSLSEHIRTKREEYGIGYQGIFNQNDLLKINCIGAHHTLADMNLARPFNAKENSGLIDAQYTHVVSGTKHRITAGATYKDEDIKEALGFHSPEKKGGKTVGAYIQDEIEHLKNKDFVLGIRFDRTQSTFVTASSFSPRVAMRWVINPAFTFRASLGSGFRVPYYFSEDMHLCSCAPLIYNPGTLKPERSLSFNMSGEYEKKNLFIEINLFRTDIQKKIYFTRLGAPQGFDFIYVNGSGAYSQGIEANGRYHLSSLFDINFGLTLTDARYNEPQDYSIGLSRMIMRSPRYMGLIQAKYKDQYTGISASVSGRLTGNMFIENYVEKRIDKTSPYATCDISFQKEFSKQHIMLMVGIDNVFNYVQKVIYNPLQDQGSAYIYAPLVGRYIYITLALRK